VPAVARQAPAPLAAAGTAPPPAIISGRRASRRRKASASSPSVAATGAAGTGQGSGDSSLASAVITSRGISICTGPGRALRNTANALASTLGKSRQSISVWLKRAHWLASARWSGSSCSRPSPMPSCSRRHRGNHQHRHRIGQSLHHRRYCVAKAGAGNQKTGGGSTTGAGIPISHERRTLLVPR
jgi:hypothetical protein